MFEATSDDAYVRQILWQYFPDFRGKILELEIEERELLGEDAGCEVGSYSLVSEIFMEEILLPSLEVRDVESMTKSSEFIEDLIESDRDYVIEVVCIRIADYLLRFANYWLTFRDFAGPKLAQVVAERGRHFNFDPFSR